MTDHATVAAGAKGGPDERDAELILARTADARILTYTRPSVHVTTIVAYAFLAIAGIWLRGVVHPSGPTRWPTVIYAVDFLAAVGLALPTIARLTARSEPKWVAAARIHQQSLDSRVPAATLALLQHCLARMPRQEGYIYVSRCTRRDPVHFEICHAAGVLPLQARLLVVMGEHVATGPSQLAAAVLAHESRHVTWVRLRLSCLGAMFGAGGWVLVGWAVRGLALLPAMVALWAALTVWAWLIEISCDVGSARECGRRDLLEALARTHSALMADRATDPMWKQWALSVLAWAGGGAKHPPVALRRAIVRVLAGRHDRRASTL